MTKGRNGNPASTSVESTVCPIHGKVLVCPSCAAAERGRKGGRARTGLKVETAKRNAVVARKALKDKLPKK